MTGIGQSQRGTGRAVAYSLSVNCARARLRRLLAVPTGIPIILEDILKECPVTPTSVTMSRCSEES